MDETSEMPTCPAGRSPEFQEGWAAYYYLDRPCAESNPYRQGALYERWNIGWLEAQRRHWAAKTDTPAEQPAPAQLPRVIWEGTRKGETPLRVVQVDATTGDVNAFVLEERLPKDAMGEQAWRAAPWTNDLIVDVLYERLAWEYLRKLAGEDAT